MIVADSDVLVDFLEDEGAASHVAVELERSRLRTTVISRFELLSGARSDRQAQMIAELLAVVPAFALDPIAADIAASTYRELETRGQRIGMADCLIAGIVLARDLPLMTRNRRHFQRVPGLELAEVD